MENDVMNEKVEDLKTEFAKVMKEVEILSQQATEKRTRLVEIQGAIKVIEELKVVKPQENTNSAKVEL